jgi:hypothetical protein
VNNAAAHQKLVDELLFAFGSRPNIRVWIRVVGYDYKNHIAFGIPGESDIQGIVAPAGRMLSIEVKTGKAVLSEKQMRWRNVVLKFGGIFVEARSVAQAIADFNSQL